MNHSENTSALTVNTEPSHNQSVSSTPARLAGAVTLTLHTMTAQHLFKPPNQRRIHLLQFGGRMTAIWLAAQHDDPYADWFLLKAYDGLIKLRHQLADTVAAHQEQLEAASPLNPLDFNLLHSETPITYPLHFGTQYGFLGASLIAHYDTLMRIILTAKYIGILLDQPYDHIQRVWKKQIRTLFRLPFQWKRFGITRPEVNKKTQTAQAAEQHMGQLPEAVRTAQLRSPFSPPIKILPRPQNDEPSIILHNE